MGTISLKHHLFTKGLSATVARQQQHQEIAADLRKQIREGRTRPRRIYPLGSRAVPAVRVCARNHSPGCCHPPQRRLISSGQGRRSRVLDTVPTQDFDDIISFSQWCHNSGIEPGQETQWVTRCRANAEMATRLEINTDDPIVSVLRLRLMDGTPAMVERLNYPLEVGKHVLVFDPDSGSIYQQLLNCGVDISHATRTIDAVGANEEDAELLGVTPGTPLLRVRRHAFTLDGTPIEASDDRYLPHMANFTVSAVRGTPSPASMVRADAS
ncbi:Transcriptional regulator, GntR family [Corynebacterium camporealensis]|nr:Transcriptional regulator, GntR family [Corynebacterium camporealensis]